MKRRASTYQINCCEADGRVVSSSLNERDVAKGTALLCEEEEEEEEEEELWLGTDKLELTCPEPVVLWRRR
uniref:Uncharacterized protein n=1 Tax=Knipowitschia caucasica TaxID=637954 RepID=A0AAV2LAF0_KNICA